MSIFQRILSGGIATGSSQADEVSDNDMFPASLIQAKQQLIDQAHSWYSRNLVSKTVDLDAADLRYSTAMRVGEVRSTHFCVVGVGGVGSWVVKFLVGMGARRVTIVDFDTIEIHNVGPQGFDIMDLGRPKVDALRDQMLVHRGVELHTVNAKLESYSELVARCGAPDVLVMAVDNMEYRNKVWAELKQLAQVPSQEITESPTSFRGAFPTLPKVLINPAMTLGEWTCFIVPFYEMLRVKNYPGYYVFEDKELRPGALVSKIFEQYEENAVFTDGEAAPEVCTARAIQYTGANIATYIACFMHAYVDGLFTVRGYGDLEREDVGIPEVMHTNLESFFLKGGSPHIPFYWNYRFNSRNFATVSEGYYALRLRDRLQNMRRKVQSVEGKVSALQDLLASQDIYPLYIDSSYRRPLHGGVDESRNYEAYLNAFGMFYSYGPADATYGVSTTAHVLASNRVLKYHHNELSKLYGKVIHTPAYSIDLSAGGDHGVPDDLGCGLVEIKRLFTYAPSRFSGAIHDNLLMSVLNPLYADNSSNKNSVSILLLSEICMRLDAALGISSDVKAAASFSNRRLLCITSVAMIQAHSGNPVEHDHRLLVFDLDTKEYGLLSLSTLDADRGQFIIRNSEYACAYFEEVLNSYKEAGYVGREAIVLTMPAPENGDARTQTAINLSKMPMFGCAKLKHAETKDTVAAKYAAMDSAIEKLCAFERQRRYCWSTITGRDYIMDNPYFGKDKEKSLLKIDLMPIQRMMLAAKANDTGGSVFTVDAVNLIERPLMLHEWTDLQEVGFISVAHVITNPVPTAGDEDDLKSVTDLRNALLKSCFRGSWFATYIISGRVAHVDLFEAATTQELEERTGFCRGARIPVASDTYITAGTIMQPARDDEYDYPGTSYEEVDYVLKWTEPLALPSGRKVTFDEAINELHTYLIRWQLELKDLLYVARLIKTNRIFANANTAITWWLSLSAAEQKDIIRVCSSLKVRLVQSGRVMPLTRFALDYHAVEIYTREEMQAVYDDPIIGAAQTEAAVTTNLGAWTVEEGTDQAEPDEAPALDAWTVEMGTDQAELGADGTVDADAEMTPVEEFTIVENEQLNAAGLTTEAPTQARLRMIDMPEVTTEAPTQARTRAVIRRA